MDGKRQKTGEIRVRKGINGKNFEKKARYNQLNKSIDEFCMEHYGVTYTKGKGKEPGHGKSVEELKAVEKLHHITAQVNEQEQRRIREQELAKQAKQQQEAAEQAIYDAELQANALSQQIETQKTEMIALAAEKVQLEKPVTLLGKQKQMVMAAEKILEQQEVILTTANNHAQKTVAEAESKAAALVAEAEEKLKIARKTESAANELLKTAKESMHQAQQMMDDATLYIRNGIQKQIDYWLQIPTVRDAIERVKSSEAFRDVFGKTHDRRKQYVEMLQKREKSQRTGRER